MNEHAILLRRITTQFPAQVTLGDGVPVRTAINNAADEIDRLCARVAELEFSLECRDQTLEDATRSAA